MLKKIGYLAGEDPASSKNLTGKGHRTRAIGNESWRQIFVILP